MSRGFSALRVPDGTSNTHVYSDPAVSDRGASPMTDVSCAVTLASDFGSTSRRIYATPCAPEEWTAFDGGSTGTCRTSDHTPLAQSALLHNPRIVEERQTHPPLPGRHVPTKERDGPPEPTVFWGTDDPLEDPPVRARPTALRFGGVVDPTIVALCACIDDVRDRGGGGAEEGKVDPSRVFARPWIGIALLTIGRTRRVVRGGVREGDEFEVGAIAEDL